MLSRIEWVSYGRLVLAQTRHFVVVVVVVVVVVREK
jgi:hypothetical protein